MRKNVRLNNVLFPFWMLMLFPVMWIIVLPGNFLIDSIVLLISMKILKISEKKKVYKRSILKIFFIGIVSDIVGSAHMLALILMEIGSMGDEIYITLPAVFISAILIFVLNYYVTFKKFEKKTRLWMALIFALVTAPYTFMVPSSLLYR